MHISMAHSGEEKAKVIDEDLRADIVMTPSCGNCGAPIENYATRKTDNRTGEKYLFCTGCDYILND